MMLVTLPDYMAWWFGSAVFFLGMHIGVWLERNNFAGGKWP